MENKEFKISVDEWNAIGRELEQYHAVFYTIWQLGKPVFSDSVDTAAVQFDEEGQCVLFHFNPKFWQECDNYKRFFVICHEALHVILNHGTRILDSKNAAATNCALDIVVNHLLLEKFGFQRDRIEGAEDLCWVDTVFKDQKVSKNECFEFYFNLLKKENSKSSSKDSFDDHSMLGGFDKTIEELNERLTPEEKQTIKDVIEKHFNKTGQNAGTGTGGEWHFSNAVIIKKKKWETVIKNWAFKYLKNREKEIDQWARINRRYNMISSNLFLPSEMEVDEKEKEKTRITVDFYLDTSGSCWGLKDRFFAAALSLPVETFDVNLFCFDTQVVATTLASRKIYGGGGTRFDIIETNIQNRIGKGKYPTVFIISDGYGSSVKPQMPERWHWFLSSSYKRFIPNKSKVFNLKDFE